MTIIKYQIFGKNSVGVYLTVNNSFGLYPSILLKPAVEKIKSVFKVPFYPNSINNSNLIGVYTASNKYGIIVPHLIREDELQQLKNCSKEVNSGYQIGVLKSLDNAFGNLILCNDKGAIISSFLKDYKDQIEDTLKVETVIYEFVNNYLPGSISISNNKGCLVHPLTTDKEIEIISEILKVEETDVSTVNRGIPYLSSGAIVNDQSGIFGNNCTGPELMRLSNVLML
ncbi:MAG: translation initiation factor IF-6 [Candidatus Lokiarchaeota archaeon]|jgi:translation initiation factor 6|nr:translation initiation factor IF-6 [Candidatus Lokiarchaeota archaeon]